MYPIELAGESVIGYLSLIVHPLTENRRTYLAHAEKVGRALSLDPISVPSGKTLNLENPVARALEQGSSLAIIRHPAEWDPKGGQHLTKLTLVTTTMLHLLIPDLAQHEDYGDDNLLQKFNFGKRYNVQTDIECCDRCCTAKPPSSFKRCSRCKVAKYCSKECQTEDWTGHKVFCIPRD